MTVCLIDAGPLIAYYDAADPLHRSAKEFIEQFVGQFVTTSPVLTEALWMLNEDFRVQNELLLDVARGLYQLIELTNEDFSRIAELNAKYNDLPADFGDLSLIVISERLREPNIASIDSDFDIYRRLGRSRFVRVFPKLK